MDCTHHLKAQKHDSPQLSKPKEKIILKGKKKQT